MEQIRKLHPPGASLDVQTQEERSSDKLEFAKLAPLETGSCPAPQFRAGLAAQAVQGLLLKPGKL